MSAVSVARWRLPAGQGAEAGARVVPEELPVAFVLNGESIAVLLASPSDLEDFAQGFCFTEGIAETLPPGAVEVVRSAAGVELALALPGVESARLRGLPGPSGCGLCGVRALADALRPPARVGPGRVLSAAALRLALSSLDALQPLARATRAVHAAAWYTPEEGVVLVREDVGRHNALDKLIGALRRAGRAPGDGALLLTSRLSLELVQKAAAFGAPLVAAISAPTDLALRTADEAGITVLAVVRPDAAEVFTHPYRVQELT